MKNQIKLKSLCHTMDSKVEINADTSDLKASHPSSNPINDADKRYNPRHSHFEVEVNKAFFRVFNL